MGFVPRRVLLVVPVFVVAVLLAVVPTVAFGDRDRNEFRARLFGVNETPSISTDATGSLRVRINGSGNEATIEYTLTYSGLRAPVTQAHIHFAQERVAGGIMVFLCGTTFTATTSGPAGTPTCPQSGTVHRTLTAADVVGPTGQGIAAGEMARVVQAIRDGAGYGNVHSQQFQAGEIRGQLRADDD